jgi:hypothetical protein
LRLDLTIDPQLGDWRIAILPGANSGPDTQEKSPLGTNRFA